MYKISLDALSMLVSEISYEYEQSEIKKKDTIDSLLTYKEYEQFTNTLEDRYKIVIEPDVKFEFYELSLEDFMIEINILFEVYN